MSLKELAKVIAPPATPLNGGNAKLRVAVEAKLKTPLPPDYWEFASHYGSGAFNDPGRLVINVFNPFATDYLSSMKERLSGLRDYFKEVEFFFDDEEREGFPLHPKVPGLLPWGSDDNGNQLFWYTDGSPDEWPVVFYAHDGDSLLERFDLSMTSFLAKAFSRTITITDAWKKPFFTGKRKVKFAQTDADIEYQ
jgi:hypothetical protein